MSAPFSKYEQEVLEWVNEAIDEAEQFLENQVGYSEIEKSIKYIQGEQRGDVKPEGMADFVSNRLGKVATDIAAGLTDIKPIFTYNTFNETFTDQAGIFNDLARSWFLNNFIDVKLAGVVQLAIPCGCAYGQLVYDPNLNNGFGDIDLIPRDPRDILPIRPSTSISIQDSMGVIIRSFETTNALKRKYPHLKERIVADTEGGTQPRDTAYTRLMSRLVSPALAALSKKPQTMKMRIPGKIVYTVYLKDDSINESNEPRKMGYGPNDEKYSWSYTVQPDMPLYPRGRVIICSKDIIYYDGVNPYWHGKFPLIKLPMDLSFVYPDSFLSKSVIGDLIPHQDMINGVLNAVLDHLNQSVDPTIAGDRRAISEEQLNAFAGRQPGARMLVNPGAGEAIKFVTPPQLPQYTFDLIEFLTREIEYLSGSQDLSNLMQVKQLPSAESVEAIMQAMTPTTRMRGRILESVIRELADMMKFNFMQFYDTPRRLAILGPDGLTMEDFDFDPGSMVPDGDGERIDRALTHAANFGFYVTPNSMLEIATYTKKLLYMQLRKTGEIDHTTLLETLEVPNIEQINERLTSEIDQKIIISQGLQAGTPGPVPSSQVMPHLETRGGLETGGETTTIAES